MRGFAAALEVVLVCGFAALAGSAPAEAKSVDEFSVGQWDGYSYTDDANGQFVDCEIWTGLHSGALALQQELVAPGQPVLPD